MVIGVTGVIGSGKSLVGKLLKGRGFVVIEADELAREVVRPGTPALAEVVKSFGAGMLAPDGTLNRRQLGEVVFKDPVKRKALEAILHPAIRKLWLEKLDSHKESNVAYIVPLLFESGEKYPELDKKILVAADRKVCLARIMARDSLSEAEAVARLDAQMSIEQKIPLSDFIIWNDGSEEDAAKQLDTVISAF
jgi:dephospho-CoA kinase